MNDFIYDILYTIIEVLVLIIITLYLFIIYKRIYKLILNLRTKNYKTNIIPLIDRIIFNIEISKPCEEDIKLIRLHLANKSKRMIIEQLLAQHFNDASVDKKIKLSRFCESLGLIELEVKYLKTKNQHDITWVCNVLGEFRSKKAIPEILKVLEMDRLDIRYHALLALSKIGDVQAFKQAFELLDDNFDLSQRSIIEIIDSFEGNKLEMYNSIIDGKLQYTSIIFIKSAGNYGDKSVSTKIAQYIKSKNKNMRAACIKALGQLKANEFVDDLIMSLKDDEWECRAVAAKSLGQIEDERALDSLIDALSDREWWVRYNSAWSILKIPDGINYVGRILNGKDKFAKDIIISVLENTGSLDLILNSQSAEHEKTKKILEDYFNISQVDFTSKGVS